MSEHRRIWVEEASREFGWSLVACEFCVVAEGAGRTWFPVLDARAFAEAHAEQHGVAGVVPRVHDEAELVCIEPECRRRAHHADGRCRACWVRLKRAAKVAA